MRQKQIRCGRARADSRARPADPLYPESRDSRRPASQTISRLARSSRVAERSRRACRRRPAWKLSRHANRHNRFRMVSGPFLLHDQTNAAQGRTSGFDVCGLSNHDQLRAKRPRKVSAATATRLRISRRHRAISCLERRNVIAGIAFLVRSARYASIARESRCQTLSGVGAPLAAPPSSWAGTTLMRGYLLFIPSAAAANMRFSAYEFETADSSDS